MNFSTKQHFSATVDTEPTRFPVPPPPTRQPEPIQPPPDIPPLIPAPPEEPPPFPTPHAHAVRKKGLDLRALPALKNQRDLTNNPGAPRPSSGNDFSHPSHRPQDVMGASPQAQTLPMRLQCPRLPWHPTFHGPFCP